MGDFYGVVAQGTYKSDDTEGKPGDARYLKDDQGNIVLGPIGNGIPNNIWALNNSLTFHKFDLNILLTAATNFDVLNLTRAYISMVNGSQGSPTYGEYRNKWTIENQTDVPAGGDLFVNSTRFLEKGDFMRLSNLSLGYNLKSQNFFKRIRIYSNIQNLFTVTKYSGYDPEASSTGVESGIASSIDYGANPNPRIITLGVNMMF